MYQKISIFHLYKKIIKNYWNHNQFVLFRKPYENQVFLYSHSDSKEEKFFLIQDFDHNHTIKIVPKKIYFADIQKSKKFYKNNSFKNNSFLLTDSLEYKNLIKKAVEKIRKGYFKKVVLSRSIKISFHSFYLKNTFQKLIFSYPNALVSLWYDISHGFWIGCSPELLMQVHKKKFKTVALAGTIWNKYKWTKKEKEEHQIVIKYIVHLLKKNYSGSIFLEKTKTVEMGHLKHLETPICFSFLEEPDYYEILNKLYPTPSICGFPKKESLDFIQKYEGYKRNFYTGYIGIVNRKSMELYLHLRCARIKENKKEITLYAGSGITIDSDIDREYLETENKVQNIFSQLIFK